jgi:hypothetical protein
MRNSMGLYAEMMKQVAEQEKVFLIDLNSIVINRYNEIGQEKVQKEFFNTGDHTHTSLAGAKMNAACVVEGIRALRECGLRQYLRDKPSEAADSGPGGTAQAEPQPGK